MKEAIMEAKTCSISFLASLAKLFLGAALAISAFATLALLLSMITTSVVAVSGEQGPLVHIETTSGPRLRGFLREARGDSIILLEEADPSETERQAATRRMTSLHLNNIALLSVPRKSRLSTGIIWSLSMGAVGALLGFASGDDPPGLVSFSAGQKAGLLGSAMGYIGLSVGGSYGALKGVDLDVPWEGKTAVERSVILSRLRAGRCRCRNGFRISPWAGVHSPPEGKTAAVYGGRVRFYFTPRSGMELAYGGTGWSSIKASQHDPGWSYTKRLRMSRLSGSFFIYPVRTRPVMPFVAWGWGRTTTQTDETQRHPYGENEYGEWKNSDKENFFAAYLSTGIEVPLTNRLSLEGRIEDIWALTEGHYASFQLSMILGLNN
jgi:hypothetical protein